MNELYLESMAAAVQRLYDEAGRRHGRRHRQREEDLLRRRQPQEHGPGDQGRRRLGLRDGRGGQGRAAQARDVPQAGRRRDQRRRARRRLRDLPGHQPPDRGRRRQGPDRPARVDPRPAARRRRRHPRRTPARPAAGPDGRAAARHPVQARAAKEKGLVDELVATREELVPAAKAWIKANPDETQNPWDKPGYKMPGGTPKSPGARRLPAGVPGAAAQADQGRASTRRRGRSCPPPSRARRSTSTPRRASSRAT